MKLSNAKHWDSRWREEVWAGINRHWDVIIIGGGITGAGILREATRAGLQALLVDGDDFASGTSSRSSKLVHGGFRYLKNGQIRLTYESVHERERLLKEGRGLVNPLAFLLACYRQDRLPPWIFAIGLSIYDLLALKWGHRRYPTEGFASLCPQLNQKDLLGGFRYFDAQVDDARLVFRLIRESVRQGGIALNYAHVDDLCHSREGKVRGVAISDRSPGSKRYEELSADVIINASGAWCDELRIQANAGIKPRLRKLRGSHLVFSYEKLPLTRAVCVHHPEDNRPVFAVPWEGVTLVGTTDVDHPMEAQTDPAISDAEANYLIAWVNHAFPSLQLELADVQATFSGIRAVVNTGKSDPSKESREHILWQENGLLSVSGGKLTTFRIMAHTALKFISGQLAGRPRFEARARLLDPPLELQTAMPNLGAAVRLRLFGRYGPDVFGLSAKALASDWDRLDNTPVTLAELRWAAQAEGVVHLDDLLLRRVRLGLLLPQGGLPWLDRLRDVLQAELNWEDQRWEQEVHDYTNLWLSKYSLPTIN